jgi:hypothetical protein
MTLHIFNPEHDIALASNLSNFTAPHAGRQLRNDLGFLPALWAEDGDQILVEHEESAIKSYRRVCHRLEKLGITASHSSRNVQLLCKKRPFSHQETARIQPWGWDKAIRRELERMGFSEPLLPTMEQTERIRMLSHRRTSAQLLPQLQTEGTVGEAFECTTYDEVAELLNRYDRLVLKAPWSSSGRGVRFCDAARLVNGEELVMKNWVRNVINMQGSMMAEPYFNKVKDFGMEFSADDEGHIHYLGLSLFHTVNGAYEGNILATESTKMGIISRYIPVDLLENIKQNIISKLNLDGYVGPFGVDMMICAAERLKDNEETTNDKRCLLHPCVEINLRRTMGHVALCISPTDDDIRGIMRVIYDDNHYKLKINKLR